jgi:hypothetical protein
MAKNQKRQQSADRKTAILERRERVNAIRKAGPRGVESKDMPSLNATAKAQAEERTAAMAAARGEPPPAAKKSSKRGR